MLLVCMHNLTMKDLILANGLMTILIIWKVKRVQELLILNTMHLDQHLNKIEADSQKSKTLFDYGFT